MLIIIWSAFERGELNTHGLGRDFVFILMIVVPIAAAGIIVFGLPLMFMVRRLGWISTIVRFKFFGVAVGVIWAIIVGLVLNFRVEAFGFAALIGGVNGLVVAWLWLNIVDKFRASQRHQNLVGEAS